MMKQSYIFLAALPVLPELIWMNFPYTCFNLPSIDMPPQIKSKYVENLRAPGAATAIINYYRACLDPKFLLLEENRQIREPLDTPVLLMWGEQDMVAARDASLIPRELVPNLSTVYFPNLHHWVNQEAPNTVNKLIGEFLAHHGLGQVA